MVDFGGRCVYLLMLVVTVGGRDQEDDCRGLGEGGSKSIAALMTDTTNRLIHTVPMFLYRGGINTGVYLKFLY